MDTGTTEADREGLPNTTDPPSTSDPSEGTVTVLGFGPLRDALPVDVPWEGGTTRQLLDELGERFPRLEDWIPQAVVVVDGAKADEDRPIRPGSTVELLPPISGG